MKELLITIITLAGLFIGVAYYDSIMGWGQAEQLLQESPAPEQ